MLKENKELLLSLLIYACSDFHCDDDNASEGSGGGGRGEGRGFKSSFDLSEGKDLFKSLAGMYPLDLYFLLLELIRPVYGQPTVSQGTLIPARRSASSRFIFQPCCAHALLWLQSLSFVPVLNLIDLIIPVISFTMLFFFPNILT